jgi:oligopeptide/dipeptide ABC transporter ATP-binding protein
VTLQAQILRLLSTLQIELGLGILLITHDLGVVAETCDRVSVLYAGQIVEHGLTSEVFASPSHPYTEGLLNSLPTQAAGEAFRCIRGVVPMPADWPSGCRFHTRCQYDDMKRCRLEGIELLGESGHLSRCIRLSELKLNGV